MPFLFFILLAFAAASEVNEDKFWTDLEQEYTTDESLHMWSGVEGAGGEVEDPSKGTGQTGPEEKSQASADPQGGMNVSS